MLIADIKKNFDQYLLVLKGIIFPFINNIIKVETIKLKVKIIIKFSYN